VKIILAGVAFATLMALPLFAQRQTHEGFSALKGSFKAKKAITSRPPRL
jgi:hypothetical protein